MKRTFLSLFCFLFFFSAYSAEASDFSTSEAAKPITWTSQASEPVTALTTLAERARAFSERIPQEKVYVHMDNTCYFLGDTIWFAAYTRRTDSGKPSKVSHVLYAELWNHDGFLVERKLVEMKEGRGHGYFALPDTLYSGYFELRAYTRWQLNWGQTVHPHKKFSEQRFYNKEMADEYFRDYEKLYSRVFPVYDKPREEGVFARDMTMRPLRRYFRSAPKEEPMRLSLFPEGGSLVAGVPCRVAFEAAEADGEAVEGELQVTDGTNVVATARTENRGRGVFTFTPEAGGRYEAVFTADGREENGTIRERIRDIQTDGVALQVRRESEAWVLTVRAAGKARDIPLGVTVMHEGKTSFFTELTNNEIRIEGNRLPAGVNQVTVFDGEGRVWADRLFFVTRPEVMQPTVSISGLKERYEPFERIDLMVSAGDIQGDGHVSLAVRDAVLEEATYDSGNIMTEMLLASEIKGFVPQPEWFFEADDEEHRRGLDLLMLTQGWRRFNWREMAVQGAWELTHPAEQSQMVTGSVNKYSITLPGAAISNDYLDKTARDGWFYGISTAMPTAESIGGGEGVGIQAFNSVKQAGQQFTPSSESNRMIYDKEKQGKLRHEMLVHAEFIHPADLKNGVMAEEPTRNGRFNMEFPRFYGDCIFFLTARDTTLWDKNWRKFLLKKYQNKTWIQLDDDENQRIHEDAEFYTRLNFPYPRWVQPYGHYQMSAQVYKDETGEIIDDDTKQLDAITVRGRRNGRRHLDLSKPAYVLDAYEAGNMAMDAGLLTDLNVLKESDKAFDASQFLSGQGYQNTSEMAAAIIFNYIGDMNMDRRYPTALFWDSVRVAGDGLNDGFPFIDFDTQRAYSRLENIDKVYIYTDYSPRWEGNKQFTQDDQPSVEISLHRYPDHTKRLTYRDRRYILHGFAYQEDFYHPDYRMGVPKEAKDHRRTLYWNPDLQLDASGEAKVALYNSSRRTSVNVQAAGQTATGGFLYNEP